MTKRKRFASLLVALALALGVQTSAASAAGFFTNGVPPAGGTQYPSTLPLTGNETIPADTNLPSGQNPQSEAISTSQLEALGGTTLPRNFLRNGATNIHQAGTAATTGGTTTVTALQFAADGWYIDTNVAVGAGKAQVVTATPSPPATFNSSVNVWRDSGALTQPVCTMQEIEGSRSVALQGRNVVFSVYLQALAGLTSTANAVSATVITGTGTDEGFGTLTATPAITPAWTGLASSAATTWNTTTAWVRYNTPAIAIPATATEVGVQLCFTPVGSSSGTTDGFSWTGAQLETVIVATGAGPSPFEFRDIGDDLRAAQRFYFQMNEPGSGSGTGITGMSETAAIMELNLTLPTIMRGTTPVLTIPTTGTFKVSVATTATTWLPTPSTCSVFACIITTSNSSTALSGIVVTGGGSVGVIKVVNDKVM